MEKSGGSEESKGCHPCTVTPRVAIQTIMHQAGLSCGPVQKIRAGMEAVLVSFQLCLVRKRFFVPYDCGNSAYSILFVNVFLVTFLLNEVI